MARVSFEFKKGDFVWVSLIVVLLVSGFVVATWDSSKAMFHDSADVKVTIEGEGDMSLQDAIGGGFIGGMKFGSWVDMGTTTSGTATSDGVIVAYIPGGVSIRGSIGGVTRLVDHGAAASWGASITMPVKVSDSWEVVVSGGTPTVYWVPIII